MAQLIQLQRLQSHNKDASEDDIMNRPRFAETEQNTSIQPSVAHRNSVDSEFNHG